MDKEIFEVEVSNGSSEGYKTATVLKMPCTQAELRDTLQKARVQDVETCENELTNIRYPGIDRSMIGLDVDLSELNLLAIRLSMLSEDEREGLRGLLHAELAQHSAPIPLPRLINLTFNTDNFSLMPRVFSDKDLGVFLYKNGEFFPELITVIDSAGQGTDLQDVLLTEFGRRHRLAEGGVFTRQGYLKPGTDFKEVYRKGEMSCFSRPSAPVVLEVRKGFSDGSSYDNDKTAILNLPASDADIWRAAGEVDAASPDECAFRCIGCEIPALRDAVDNAIDQEGSIELANEFAKNLAQQEKSWHEVDWIKYKALLSVAGHPSLQDAIQLMHGLDDYDLRPEIAETWDYAGLVLREKYPDLPEVLFQTPQAAQVGQRMLEERHAAITDYGLLRRKDGEHLPAFQLKQKEAPAWGGMEMT